MQSSFKPYRLQMLKPPLHAISSDVSLLCRGMPDIQWMNLDPVKLMEELSQYTSLEGFKEMLDKAQVSHRNMWRQMKSFFYWRFVFLNGCSFWLVKVGHAYMNRSCLDPADPDCPLSAPNKDKGDVSLCKNTIFKVMWTDQLWKITQKMSPWTTSDVFVCRFFPPSIQSPDIARHLQGGCHGFSRKFMHWQEDLILGGLVKNSQDILLRCVFDKECFSNRLKPAA